MRIGDADRRRRLPRAERGHPGRRAQGRRRLRPRDRRLPPRLAGRDRGRDRSTRPSRPMRGIAPAGRHDPRHVADEPVQVRRRRPTRCSATLAARRRRRARSRSAARTRSASPASSTDDGVAVVGVPKTIDNDLSATDFTFGFHTAVQIATDAIDRLHTTAESHDRVMVVEVMGRHAGWIATYSGMAGGADIILIPEEPFDIDEICDRAHAPPRARRELLDRRRGRGRDAEGGHDGSCRRARSTSSATSGSAASATRLADEIEQRTGYEARVTILGHVLRGGTPDRVRPGDRDPLRHRGDRRGARGRLRQDGRAARHRRRARARSRTASAQLKTVDGRLFDDRRRLLRLSAGRQRDAPVASAAVMGRALDDLIDLLELEQLEVNLFRGVSPDEDRQRVFGGQVAGQALVAAGRTVDRPARALAARVLPAARRPDASRSSTTSTASATATASPPAGSSRSSTARAIFNLSASFHIDEAGPEHQYPMPDVPDPETLPTMRERARAVRRPVPDRVRRLDPARAPDRHALVAAARAGSTPIRARASPSSSCGSAPTASCPTTRCCTRASSPTRPTSRCSTPR